MAPDHSPPAGEPAVIAIMGATGSGKTSFVNIASGSNLPVGHSLYSCTDNIQLSPPFSCGGQDIVLVDTPGFNDTNLSDREVLTRIATYLKDHYTAGKKLKGIVWLHPINDVRVFGISKSNFKMFRNLCGDSTLVNVIIATTKWDKEDFSTAVNRENELREKDILFKPAIEKKARLVRHDNNRESAHRIIHSLFPNTPLPLQIQKEMVEMRKALGQTTAGVELKRQFESAAKDFAAKLTELDAQVDAAKKEGDIDTQRELEEERKAMSQQIRNLRLEAQKLMADYHRQKFWWWVRVGAIISIAILVIFRLRGTISQLDKDIERFRKAIEDQNEQAEKDKKMATRFAHFMGVGGTAFGYALRAAIVGF